MYNAKQCIEIFHLLFLNQLSQNLDKRLYALKGGCNLRFYFKSIRYSEDMDLDIHTIQRQTLQNKVNRILTATPFAQILKSYHLQITQVSDPKQTDTVQRWKIALATPVTRMPLPTKIEFSRRNMTEEVTFSVVDRQLLTTYEMPPLLANHYTKEAMWQQKILALAHRQQPQARDIFDLYLLLEQNVATLSRDNVANDIYQSAKINANALTYEDYQAQVISYLLPEYQSQFGSMAIWDQIVQEVMIALEQ